MNKIKLSKLFRAFLLSYLVILLIPNIAGYFSYRVSINAAQKGSINTSLMILKQSRDILERRISEVQNFTRQLAINPDITLIMNENVKKDSLNIYGLWKTWRDVSYYDKTNDFLQDYYIYLNNYDVVLTPASIYFRPNHYYELYHYRDLSFEEWKETIVNQSHQNKIIPLLPYIHNKKEISVITYVQSLPLNSFSKPKGTVVVTIDEAKISSILESISLEYGGWAYITDSDGNPLASAGINVEQIEELGFKADPNEIETKAFVNDTLLITVRSETSGWVYTAGIPKPALMEQANVIRRTTWTVNAIALLVGLLICLLLAYRNSVPITRLVRIVKEQIGQDSFVTRNDYDFLHGNIASLITDNKWMETELNRQIPLIRDAFLKRLLKGEFNSSSEIQAAVSQSGIDLHGNYGYAVIIRINGYSGMNSKDIWNELHATRLIISQMFRSIHHSIAVTELDSEKIAAIMTFAIEPDKEDIGETDMKLMNFSAAVEEEYRISVTISIGSLFQCHSDISRSFDEARLAMDYATSLSGYRTIWYQQIRMDTATYYYPIDQEMRLLNAMKVGEKAELRRITDRIFMQNLLERTLSSEMLQQLVGEIKGTILKLIDQKIIQDPSDSEKLKNQTIAIQLVEGIDQVREELEVVMDHICELIVRKKTQKENETISKILELVEEQFVDANLNLYLIAEFVGRPEKYITQLFKEQTGDNITDYLENTRIKKASELLFDSNLTIDEIAVQVGYNSSHSFRRAFKRVSGVSPSLARKSKG